MDRVLLLSPSVSSLNMGDHIITDAAQEALGGLLDDAFVIEVSTHLPLSRFMAHIGKPTHTFVCGSNLLRGRMNRPFRQWDVTPLSARWLHDAVLLGAGWWQYNDHPNRYTRQLYRRILHPELLHSVRDAYTEQQMRRMGFTNVVNTGCPTMWTLTPEHCATIPAQKAARAVCTITDYKPAPDDDRAMLATLCERYEKVTLWMQGVGDSDYFDSLGFTHPKLEVLAPALENYNAVLDSDVDFIGTRLHAGIRALQRGRRAMILSVDNRAQELNRDFGIPVIPRGDEAALLSAIEQPRTTDVRIDQEAINRWRDQFPIE